MKGYSVTEGQAPITIWSRYGQIWEDFLRRGYTRCQDYVTVNTTVNNVFLVVRNFNGKYLMLIKMMLASLQTLY